MSNRYDIAAYIWPSYTGDEPRSRIFWPEGYGEWQTVKAAGAKFSGHEWPRKPLWGYVNEADPYVMQMQIDCAADHGVNVFIYDWYWYDGRPFLEQCLDNGFLKAQNNGRMKFYLMWANHDAGMLWDKRNSGNGSTVVWRGATTEKDFDEICDRWINMYFVRDNYYKINGEPLLMIYDIANFISTFGSVEAAGRGVDRLREKCVRAGLPGIHMQLCQWQPSFARGRFNGAGVDPVELTPDAFDRLGFRSSTNYQFVHFVYIDRDYNEIASDARAAWDKFAALYPGRDYFPHVSVGWDTNPRYIDLVGGIVKNNTPENVKKALETAKEYVDSHTLSAPLITVNSWNEWTETSYLEPDDRYGYGYLEAIKDVFVGRG